MSIAPTTWRLSKKSRNTAIICLPCFAVIGLASVWFSWANLNGSIPHPGLAATMFGVFWGFWVLLSSYLLLLYRQYSLSVDSTTIRQIGAFSDRKIFHQSVSEMKWKCYPAGGGVRLSDQNNTLKIEFGNFAPQERTEIIDLLHESIAPDHQVGWDKFQQRFEPSPEKRAASKRISKFLTGLLAFHFVAFAVMGMMGFGAQFIVVAILNGVMMISMLRSKGKTPHVSDSEATASGSPVL